MREIERVFALIHTLLSHHDVLKLFISCEELCYRRLEDAIAVVEDVGEASCDGVYAEFQHSTGEKRQPFGG